MADPPSINNAILEPLPTDIRNQPLNSHIDQAALHLTAVGLALSVLFPILISLTKRVATHKRLISKGGSMSLLANPTLVLIACIFAAYGTTLSGASAVFPDIPCWYRSYTAIPSFAVSHALVFVWAVGKAREIGKSSARFGRVQRDGFGMVLQGMLLIASAAFFVSQAAYIVSALLP